MYTREIA